MFISNLGSVLVDRTNIDALVDVSYQCTHLKVSNVSVMADVEILF